MPLLDIRNLTIEFKTNEGWVKAVDRVSLTLAEGEIRGLVGESGSGKSLIAKAICGVTKDNWRVTADRMRFDDIDLLRLSNRERRKLVGHNVSMIFQEPQSCLDPSERIGQQLKQNIPGFYGVGSALKELSDKVGVEKIKSFFQNSLFFRTLLSNSMMSLTKTNYQATTYLKDDPQFGSFWEKMFAEFELSNQQVLSVSGLTRLMDNNPTQRASVILRERIVLPLIAIQQFALMNLRNQDENNKSYEARYRKLIIRCMFGIINAARNSA